MKKSHVWLFLCLGQMCSVVPSNFSHFFVKPNIAKHLFTFAFLVGLSYLNVNFKAYCIKVYVYIQFLQIPFWSNPEHKRNHIFKIIVIIKNDTLLKFEIWTVLIAMFIVYILPNIFRSFRQHNENFASVTSLFQSWSVKTDAIFFSLQVSTLPKWRPEEKIQLYKVKKETETLWSEITH